MNFHFPNPLDLFRPKPSRAETRYMVPTGPERVAAQRLLANRRASIQGQLAVYNATTSLAQRQSDAERFHQQFMQEWPALRRADKRRRTS